MGTARYFLKRLINIEKIMKRNQMMTPTSAALFCAGVRLVPWR
jgi:hypothetical protein